MPIELTDAELSAAAKDGDDIALAALYSRHHTSLITQSVRQLNGDIEAARDVAQGVWVRVRKHLNNYDPSIRPFASWLHCIRIRLVLDVLKARKLANKTLLFLPSLDGFAAPRQRRTNEALALAIAKLPVKLRDAIRVVYIEDRPFTEAACVLGCSVGGAHKRTVKAIRLLREMLGVGNNAPVRRVGQRRRRKTMMVA
jgi:RNA polymerase sigma-70 factor (ECF subfamily)